MTLAIIAAVARGGVIGRRGKMPWHLPADLAHFKRLTLGHPIIMGRRTWESLPGVLPGRPHLVLSRRQGLVAPGATVCATLEEALEAARHLGASPPFVIGGAELYRLAMPLASHLYLTRVEAEIPGDTRFPDWDTQWAQGAAPGWEERSRQTRPADARNPHALTFVEYARGG